MIPAIRITALVLWSAVCVLAFGLLKILFSRKVNSFPKLYHSGVLRVFGIKITSVGSMQSSHPTLFICNHISYLDIFVLGAVINGAFVAKAEVAKWPVAGYMAKLQRTVFIERQRRSRTGEQRNLLQSRLEDGDNIILFPEGTSFDGARVLPFKSALFAAAEQKIGDSSIKVQPVSIAYTTMDGLPLTRAQRPSVAWYGDMSLLPHILNFLKASKTEVTLKFHTPVSMDEFKNRRQLSTHCHNIIAKGVEDVIYNRSKQ